MKVMHLNCGSACPMGAKTGVPELARIVCHCLLIETPSGLTLVDSGMAKRHLGGSPRESNIGTRFMRFDGGPEESAIEQIKALGYKPGDVRDIIVTHLDWDHAGGIEDFPGATVHVYGPEWEASIGPRSAHEAIRYRQVSGYEHKTWRKHLTLSGERWFGFEAVRQMPGLSDDLLLIPLPGHTRGHSGVAVRTSSGWLLHAGDAYFNRAQIDDAPTNKLGLRLFDRVINGDMRLVEVNRRRLAELKKMKEVTIFSSHDAAEFQSLRAHP